MPLLDTDEALTGGSYYAASVSRPPPAPALQGSASTDVAVVGGGLAGLGAALDLRARGFDVMLLEAREVGWGASGRNGGQAIHGLACDLAVIEAQLGLAEARRVWAMTLEALALIGERCRAHVIDCDWRAGYLAVATSARKARALRADVERMAAVYDYPQTWLERSELPRWIVSPRYVAGAHDPRAGHLHPLKYCLGLRAAALGLGVRLHEHSPVTGLDADDGHARLTTAAGAQVRARQVLLAGNVYLQQFGARLAPRLAARIMPVGTYIVATAPLGPERAQALLPGGAAVCDTNFVLDYFRTTADHRLLYGGRVSYSTATPPNLAAGLRRRMQRSFPQLGEVAIEHAWGGFVDISMNRAPDFGRLGRNVYYLQGFSGHGLALAGLAGRLVAEAMAGDASRFDVFARLRHRRFPGGALLRMPALVAGMAWYRLRDLL